MKKAAPLVLFFALFVLPNFAFADTITPGTIEGEGSFFKISNSEYLNIGLESSEPIKARVESIPNIIMLALEPIYSIRSSKISLSGLAPLATYYKYQDDFHNLEIFISDENGNYTYLQDLTEPHFIFIQTQKSTKFIKDDAVGGDCTLIGTWDAGSKTCTLNTNVNQTIQIDSDNITLDGNRHLMTGSYPLTGVYLYKRAGVTVKNLNVEKFSAGIYARESNNNTFIGNTLDSNSAYGIVFYPSSSNNTVTKNTFSRNRYFGVHILDSNYNKIYNNNFIGNYTNPYAKTRWQLNFSSRTVGNIAYIDLPTGGNYWDDFDTSGEECNDANNDNFCDAPYVFSGGQDNYPLTKLNGWLEPPTPECCSNVLFLPGFMASDLYVQGSVFENQLWPPTSLLKADIQKLMLDSNGNSVTSGIYTKSVLSEAFEFNIYKSFIEKLNSMVVNGDIKEWEGFPYDWRKDISKVVNEDTIIKIGNNFENKKLINEAIALAQRSPTKKITIIGHSNGGLVGKYLIRELANLGKTDIIDQFVMVATPQIGTPKAIAGLLHGDKQEIPPFVGILMNKELAKELGYNMQSAYNLLPTESYFNNISDPVIKFNDSINKVLDYSAFGFPQLINIFGDMFNFITSNNRGSILGESTNIPSILRSDLASNANTNINSLANWQIPSSIKVFEIAGWGEQTIKGIDYKSKQETICSTQGGLDICQPQYVWDRKLLMTNDGDGTVVIPSAINYNASNEYYLNLFDLNNTRSNLKHHNILEASQLLETLSKIFTKNLDTLPDFISAQKPISTNQKLLLSVHSPVSLGVYSNNFYTGPSSTTPTDAFTFIKEEIPNSYYLEIGEDKYIGLPEDGNYTVNLQGEAVGTFTFNQEITQGDQTIDSKSFVDIPVIPSTKAFLSINNGNISSGLYLDVDGNGSIDVQAQANNEFDSITYLNVMKSIVESFGLKRSQETDLIVKIEKLIKYIQSSDAQKTSSNAEIYVKKLNKKFEKLNNDHKNRKNGKLTEEEIQIIIQNLEEFINNLK